MPRNTVGNMFRKFASFKATPTLGGMRIIPTKNEPPGDLPSFFPWSELSGRGIFWFPTDEDGEPQRCAGKPIRITTMDDRAKRVATRLQRRWASHAIQNGSLRVTERFEDTRAAGLLLLLGAASFAVAFPANILMPYLKFRGSDVGREMSSESQVLMGCIVVLAFLMACMSAGLSLYLARISFHADRVTKGTFTATGIDATLASGESESLKWDQIESVMKRLIEFRFVGMRRLFFFPPTRRTQMILAEVALRFAKKSIDREDRDNKAARFRLAVITVIGAITAAYVGNRYAVPDDDRHLGTTGPLILILVGTLGIISLSDIPKPIEKWYYAKVRACERRKKLKTTQVTQR